MSAEVLTHPAVQNEDRRRAAATAIATTFTSHLVNSHAGATPFGGSALVRGFQLASFVLAVMAPETTISGAA